MTTKHALRQASQSRRSKGADLSVVLDAALAAAHRVASYVPLPDEPGIPPREGWLLPVLLEDGDLDWTVYDGTLASGARGVQEPIGERLGVDAIASCDLVLVPALLVDRRGHRLGKGGGSYDRALARATGLTIALVHDDEVIDVLPTEPHDVPVRAIATPSTGVRPVLGMI